MADRIVYGRSHSENNWPMVDQESCVWVRVPGAVHVSLQIREGQPAKILGAFAADWNAYIEPIRDADSACWTPTNSVASSNHLSGTACDINWNSHPFRVKDAGFNPQQLATMREMLHFYEGTVFWGNDWANPRDAMHVQMGYNTYGAQHVDKVNDFIRRKIRPDGFSTFRRVMPIAPSSAEILARATGLSIDRCRELAEPLRNGLKAAECTNPNRVAMYLAQTGHESASFHYTAEIASGDAYDTRTDLGNTPQVDGDGRLYKGRTWIQITGKHNYREFSAWACAKGLVPTPDYFVVHPLELSDLKWAGIGAAWYWTVARPDINALSDRRDLETVTRRINGGLNGLADRRTRYDRALALGAQLLTLIEQDEDDWLNMPSNAEKLDFVYTEFHKLFSSRSPYRTNDIAYETPVGHLLNNDRMSHMDLVEPAALAGEAWAIDLVARVASGRDDHPGNWLWYPDANGNRQKDQWAINHARSVLARIEAASPQHLKAFLAEKGTA